ncbi:MAG TPA: aldolase/citrate lyase family protein [Burkholderiales bacterium]|jgi:4-hydroxy-2-oxoheptanedioate aldolase|nr:aldolase/citrate lyase family protein [Burkholderiales bacterium]
MKRAELRSRYERRQPAHCLFVTIPHHITVEVAGLLGFDLVILDEEQIIADAEAMRGMIMAGERYGLSTLVRLAEATPWRIQSVLAMGAQGVLLPSLRAVDEVRRLAAAAKYPPEGTRGLGHSRATAYGLREGWTALMPRINDETMVHVIVETKEALDEIEAVAAVDQVDAVDIGLLDLSVALGCAGNTGDAKVQAAMDRIIAAAHAAGKPAGVAAPSPQAARQLIARGIDMLIIDAAAVMHVGSKAFMEARP